MLKRTKIKNKEFICNDCGRNCSRYIQKYRYTKGLFSFGPTKQQKREGEALKAMGSMFVEAVKTAKNGGEVTEEAKAQVEEAMQKVDDANTRGLAKYTRLAGEAEAKIE